MALALRGGRQKALTPGARALEDGRPTPRDLAYADWVDWSDFNAPEEYGGGPPDMQNIELPKAVDATVMMVGEVTSPGRERQELSSYSLPAVDVITEP